MNDTVLKKVKKSNTVGRELSETAGSGEDHPAYDETRLKFLILLLLLLADIGNLTR